MPQKIKRYYWLLLVPLVIAAWLVVPRLSNGTEASQIRGHYIPLVMNARTATPTPTNTATPTRTATATPTVTPTPTAGQGWREEYYANADLSGSPVAARTVDYVAPAYDWGTFAPNIAGVPADNFSVRFGRTVIFAADTYDFWVTVDDGAKLYLDNVLLIDQWHGHLRGPDNETGGTASFRWRGWVSAGPHDVRLEYYDALKDARIRLFWVTQDLTAAWRAEYFANETLSGEPALVRSEVDVNFNWGLGSPAGNIPADHFSARFTKAVYMSEQRYVFYTVADDGAQVYIDRWAPNGWKVIDDWSGSPGFKKSGMSYMGGDPQPDGSRGAWFLITVAYREGTGEAKVSFRLLPGGSDAAFVGEYYNWEVANPLNRPWGKPTTVRLDDTINFDWGLGSPAPGIGPDSFTVRWLKVVWMNAGTYRFTATIDDGARVYVDGYGPDNLVIDDWRSQQVRTDTGTYITFAGYHVVVMEYIEYTREAVAKLSWQQQ